MPKIRKKEAIPRDFGTAEMSQRLKVVPTLVNLNTYVGRVVDESEIDRMLLADHLTPSQHASLENLMRRLHKANFAGPKSPSYDAPISADPSIVGDRRANQIRSIVSLFTRLDERIGKACRLALVNLVLTDAPWPGDRNVLYEAIKELDRIFDR